jgi:SAM-dependent methyltransferase
MEYRFIDPACPSLTRWRDLSSRFPGQSVLRQLQYEHLSKLTLSGAVLDVGGGQNAQYIPLLKSPESLCSVNIDAKIEPTHLVEPGQPLPFADNSFDCVISLNTLEHIYDAAAVLRETFRVVKPGGKVHVTVPFMFRIHGHPDDYFRATPSWWRETFERVGFSELELAPLVWGRSSTRNLTPGTGGPFRKLRKHVCMMTDVLTAKLLFRTEYMTGRRARRICGTSPGWFMTGFKEN